jgi:hypothetical protein
MENVMSAKKVLKSVIASSSSEPTLQQLLAARHNQTVDSTPDTIAFSVLPLDFAQHKNEKDGKKTPKCLIDFATKVAREIDNEIKEVLNNHWGEYCHQLRIHKQKPWAPAETNCMALRGRAVLAAYWSVIKSTSPDEEEIVISARHAAIRLLQFVEVTVEESICPVTFNDKSNIRLIGLFPTKEQIEQAESK